MRKIKGHNSCKVAAASCLAVGLISTWDVPEAQAADYTFIGEITPTLQLTSVYFLFAVGICAGGGTFAQEIASSMPANVTTSFNVTFNSIPDGLGAVEGFTVLGVYDTVNGGVSMGYTQSLATYIFSLDPAPTWNGAYVPVHGPSYQYIGNTEAGVATALQNGSNTGINAVGGPFPTFSPYVGLISTDPTAPSQFTLVNFSAASPGGVGSVIQAVPEPGIFSILVPGASILSYGWFRRRTRR